MNTILVSKRSELHPNQIRHRNNHHLLAVNQFMFRFNGWSRRQIIWENFFPTEDQVDSVLRTLGASVEQHIITSRMSKVKITLGRSLLDAI